VFGGVRVDGYRELMRSFALISDGLRKDLRGQLAEATSPAKDRAQRLAGSQIRNMLSPTALVDWWKMRLGVTTTAVYLAPGQRRSGGSPRPNLGPLLMNEAMFPAVEQTMPEIRMRLDGWLDELGDGAGF